ncbi:MAG: hypothetical protein E6J87_09445 [Deltaproteobacteria bacterium]|nr:MAG: hypothetical protein E6J87_09445 [Deltaproteobacteria bacterium]
MRAARLVIATVLLVGIVAAAIFTALAPELPPAGSESARRLAVGPLAVASLDRRFVDRSRPTAANGDFAGAPERTLATTIWYPEGAPGPHPLLVYSHGFMSMRGENAPLLDMLASHGYVAVSIDYPLTNRSAPGGPNVADAVNQPGDIRFVIDQLLGMPESERPFAGGIDADRIGALGLSLGGLTTELVSFHPKLRDPRIHAAISIAGPTAMFDERFFASADLPFLMIGGTADAMIGFEENAAPVPRKVAHSGLLAIRGATHVGFGAFADGFPLRFVRNPDALGCRMLLRNLEKLDGANPLAGLGGAEEGVVLGSSFQLPCQKTITERALAAGRQLMITRLAALAFFESWFAADPAERAAQATYLAETLPRDFPEARYERGTAVVSSSN